MEKLKWYFKNGTRFEEFSVLYDDGKFILVQNEGTKKYSYGLKRDFGTLLGFPVNQSCLTVEEAKEILTNFIKIDESYIDILGDIARDNVKRWSDMLEKIT